MQTRCKVCNPQSLQYNEIYYCDNCRHRMWNTVQQNSNLLFEGHDNLDDIIRIANRDDLVIAFRLNTCPGAPVYMDILNYNLATDLYQNYRHIYSDFCMDISESSDLWRYVKSLGV